MLHRPHSQEQGDCPQAVAHDSAGPERDYLARHIATCVGTAGEDHARLVARGLEADLSVTYEPGELWAAAERELAKKGAAEWRKECAACEGEGKIEHPHMPLHTSRSETPEYAIVDCEECGGDGWNWTDEPMPSDGEIYSLASFGGDREAKEKFVAEMRSAIARAEGRS